MKTKNFTIVTASGILVVDRITLIAGVAAGVAIGLARSGIFAAEKRKALERLQCQLAADVAIALLGILPDGEGERMSTALGDGLSPTWTNVPGLELTSTIWTRAAG
jgi:hypothetical protein